MHVLYHRLTKALALESGTTPTAGIGNSWGLGVSKAKKTLRKCIKLAWTFQRGEGGVLGKLPSKGGGMDNL